MFSYKNLFRLTLLGILVFFSACTTRKQIPIKVNVQKTVDVAYPATNSVIYNLPKTVFQVEVTMEKQIKKTGPFYRYAEKFLNISNVITEDAEEWRIKSINVIEVGKVDAVKSYVVQMSGSGVANRVLLSDENVLLGMNCTNCNVPTTDLAFQLPSELKLADVNFDAVPLLEKQLQKTSTAAMAEETANYIYKLRKRRSRILTADYDHLPADGLSYEHITNEVGKLEAEFVELYAGKIVTQTIKRVFEFVPDRQSPESVVLFRLSTKNGIVDRMDLRGTPVYIEIKDLGAKTLSEQVVTKKDKDFRQGLFYNIPGNVMVRILDRNLLLFEKETRVAQFGQVATLPVSLIEQPNVSIELYPSTGAIKSISEAK